MSNKWFEKVVARVKRSAVKFWQWFREHIRPELEKFLVENKDVAVEIVIKVAKELAEQPGRAKFEAAVDMLKNELRKREGELQYPTWWLETLIQLVFAVLRSQRLV